MPIKCHSLNYGLVINYPEGGGGGGYKMEKLCPNPQNRVKRSFF